MDTRARYPSDLTDLQWDNIEHLFPLVPVGTRVEFVYQPVKVGRRDGIIPPEHSQRLFDAWGGPKRWVELPQADHNDLGAWPEFWPAITAYLEER